MKTYGSFAICYHLKKAKWYGDSFLHHYFYGPEEKAKEEVDRLNNEKPFVWKNGSYEEPIKWDEIDYFFYKEQEPMSFN